MAQYLSFMDDMNVYTDNDDPILQSPTTTTIIPDSVKKSYEQQLLPVRQQSLPCNQHTVVPVRKSSISSNTRVLVATRRRHKEPTASSIKQARRKISVRHRSSRSETGLVVVKSKSRKRCYSVDVTKKNQEQQDLLLSYFYNPSPIHAFDRACLSVIMNRLLDPSQPQRLWHGRELVVKTTFKLRQGGIFP